ncbi:MAG: zinc transporter ZupT [Candidatus Mcinerneyibacterium aminivorans]|uniref:Zinc transporter ZupT n=1 Tax=Candidatus Mcinerneyibacterium aminivorans TaxID=2703815 RepID=A0A5D0MLG6_9BACT|nr:MAG: zinc transporter ZupT [Candidatus Mcinerneyibacterium aminivorans]
MSNVLIAFILTAFAGLSTGIGSALAFYSKKTNLSFLSTSLGFSAGVMIYVSFVEILSKANESLTSALGESRGELMTAVSFFLGIAVIGIIDKFVPEFENPHIPREKKDLKELQSEEVLEKSSLMKMGLFSALAIAIHNFPEGLATFASALSDPNLGISIAIAVAIHNIPEGISVSVPIYHATGNKKKAFFYSFLSGLAEPVGALIGYFFLSFLFNDVVFGILFGSVAGIMVFISIDELLPTSRKYGKGHQVIYGFIAGMGLMAISLLLF